ncbi:MAG: TonB family protein [Burkholderiales bacterium]|nr:TonB family protein [Burkholderiales bacterium]
MAGCPGRTRVRLAAFIGLSAILHLLTGYGSDPFGLDAPRFDRPAAGMELRATLATGRAPAAPDESADAAAATAPATASSPPRAGGGSTSSTPAETGSRLPVPDKWHLASEVDVRAEPITSVALRYPENLRGEPVAGVVRLRLFIDEGGVVRKLQIAASEPAGVFDDAARSAWQEVRFSPARRNGTAVKSQKLIEVTYQPGMP